MLSKENILLALRYLKTKGITKEKAAAAMMYNRSYFSSIINGSRDMPANFLQELSEKFNVDDEMLTENNESNVMNDTTVRYNRKIVKLTSTRKNSVPFYDADASAGIVETEMTPIHAPAGTIDVGDLLHDSKAAIRIYGNSMLPNYPPGCVVGLTPSDDSFIQPGEVYVIETRKGRLFKRLFYKDDQTDSDTFTCYSDNIMKFDGGARDGRLAYPPFDVHKKDVTKLFAVTGVIKRNMNSIIMNR